MNSKKQRCGIISVNHLFGGGGQNGSAYDMVGRYAIRYCMSYCVPIDIIKNQMYVEVGVLVLRLRNLFWIIPNPH